MVEFSLFFLFQLNVSVTLVSPFVVMPRTFIKIEVVYI